MPSWPTHWPSHASSMPWRAGEPVRPIRRVRRSGHGRDRPRACPTTRRPPCVGRGGGPIGAFLVTFGDAWRVATTGGRPAAVRAQALAFVLLVLLAGAALTTVGAVGVGAFLRGNGQANPSLRPAPTVRPTNVDTTQPSESLEASDSPEPSESPEATATAEAPAATATPKSGETAKPASTIRPTRTARPTETPHAERHPEAWPDSSSDRHRRPRWRVAVAAVPGPANE